MGEAKRKREAGPPENPRHLEKTFRGMVAMVWPGAPEEQVRELRVAFFGGAAALFGAMWMKSDMTQDEPTDADMQMMEHLQFEMDEAAMGVMSEMATVKGGGNG